MNRKFAANKQRNRRAANPQVAIGCAKPREMATGIYTKTVGIEVVETKPELP